MKLYFRPLLSQSALTMKSAARLKRCLVWKNTQITSENNFIFNSFMVILTISHFFNSNKVDLHRFPLIALDRKSHIKSFRDQARSWKLLKTKFKFFLTSIDFCFGPFHKFNLKMNHDQKTKPVWLYRVFRFPLLIVLTFNVCITFVSIWHNANF